MNKLMTYKDFLNTPALSTKDPSNSSDWSKGVKFDQAKPRMDLLDPEFLEHVAQVLTFGAEKYAAHNWRNGINFSRLIAASYRHLGAINRGEDIDPESGLPHSAHLGCCIMFLDWMATHRRDLDDRWKNSETENK